MTHGELPADGGNALREADNSPHPEERAPARVSKDGQRLWRYPWPSFETAARRGAASSDEGAPAAPAAAGPLERRSSSHGDQTSWLTAIHEGPRRLFHRGGAH